MVKVGERGERSMPSLRRALIMSTFDPPPPPRCPRLLIPSSHHPACHICGLLVVKAPAKAAAKPMKASHGPCTIGCEILFCRLELMRTGRLLGRSAIDTAVGRLRPRCTVLYAVCVLNCFTEVGWCGRPPPSQARRHHYCYSRNPPHARVMTNSWYQSSL